MTIFVIEMFQVHILKKGVYRICSLYFSDLMQLLFGKSTVLAGSTICKIENIQMSPLLIVLCHGTKTANDVIVIMR